MSQRAIEPYVRAVAHQEDQDEDLAPHPVLRVTPGVHPLHDDMRETGSHLAKLDHSHREETIDQPSHIMMIERTKEAEKCRQMDGMLDRLHLLRGNDWHHLRVNIHHREGMFVTRDTNYCLRVEQFIDLSIVLVRTHRLEKELAIEHDPGHLFDVTNA